VSGYDFTLETTNTLGTHEFSDLPGGVGLDNVKKRLKLLYPGKHDLKINAGEGKFNVVLKLKLTND
jgi:two-component system LytT family sensor kinase